MINLDSTLKDILYKTEKELGKSVVRQRELFETVEERRQYESNRRYWGRWITNVEEDLEREPSRILDFYRVNSYRIEPIGVAYLYPEGD